MKRSRPRNSSRKRQELPQHEKFLLEVKEMLVLKAKRSNQRPARTVEMKKQKKAMKRRKSFHLRSSKKSHQKRRRERDISTFHSPSKIMP